MAHGIDEHEPHVGELPAIATWRAGKLLVIDEDAACRENLASLLRRAGHVVRTASDSQTAFHLINDECPDVILLSIELAGMNGFGLGSMLRQLEVTHNIPILFCIGAEQMEYRSRVFQIGRADYISKPYQRDEVCTRLSTLMQTEPYGPNADELSAAEGRSFELAKLLEMSYAVFSTLELESLLNMILEQVRAVVPTGASIVIGMDGFAEIALAHWGMEAWETEWSKGRLDGGVALDFEVLDGKSFTLVDDLTVKRSGREIVVRVFGEGAKGLLEAWRSCLLVRLIVRAETIGLLCVFHKEAFGVSIAEANLLAVFANHAAVALDNARIYQRAQTMAADEERSRLARELHDSVTQTLFSATIIADVLPDAWRESPQLGMAGLEHVRSLTRGALAEMRTLLMELRPSSLTQKSIRELLNSLCEAFTGRTKVKVDLRIADHHALFPDVQIVVYRITQEALNNIVKQGSVERVAIGLNIEPSSVRLEIEADGGAFDDSAVSWDRTVAESMRERAEVVGGRLKIGSVPERGTRIVFKWSAMKDPDVAIGKRVTRFR